jgi:D-arabinose 1-dehydrogenase-like Zn-dependent alcohol dehydrogenase
MRTVVAVTVTARAAADTRQLDIGAEAVVFLGAGRPPVIIGVPAVVLRPGETLVAVELVTLCEADARVLAGADHVHGPAVLGHEQVGRVVAVAAERRPRDVHGVRLAIGDRVIWAAGVGGHRYGYDRVSRGWELSGGCATHVHLLARTPVIRIDDDLPAAVAAVASCGAFTAEQLALGITRGCSPDGLTEFALADAAVAYAALVAGARVALRPSPLPAP